MEEGRCRGRLIVHRDGSVIACTEQLDGRECPGYDPAWHLGQLTCNRILDGIPCTYCDTPGGLASPGGLVTQLAQACLWAALCLRRE